MLAILDPKMMMAPSRENGKLESAPGGYGPPGGGWGPPGGGGYGAPPAPPGGGGYGGPPAGGGYGAPPAGGFGAPAGPAGPPPIIMMPGAGGDVNTTLPLVLNIALSALCFGTCIGSVLGVVGVVFAFQATNAKTSGDIVTAKAKARQSMMMFYVTAAIGFFLYLFIGVWQFLAPAPR